MSEELKNLYESGKSQKVLDQFTQNEVQGEWAALPEEKQIECIYYKCRSLEWLSREEEALQTAATARTTYPSPKNPSYLLALLAAQFHAFASMGRSRLDEAQSALTKGKAIMGALTDKERQTGALWIAIFEQVKGVDYWGKRELNKALEYYRKALKSFEVLDNRHGIAQCLCEIGYTYLFKGESNTAIDHYKRSIPLFESLSNKGGIGLVNTSIGQVYISKGELDKALEHCQQGLSLFRANAVLWGVGFSLFQIGHVYILKGDLDKALDYFQQSLAVFEPLNKEVWVARINWFMGMAYHQKGSLNLATSFFQRNLAWAEAVNNDYGVVKVLFSLILLTLDQQELEQAQKYLNNLQKVVTRIPDEAIMVHLRKRLAEALILKQSSRMTEKARAQTLLREIVDEDFLPEYTLIAMVALCDLLLYELRAADESEVWEEAKTLIYQFYVKAQDFQGFNMVVNALLLRAKFVTIDGELDQAQEYFNEAKMIVKEKNISVLMKKVETEQKEFEADFQKWQGLIQRHTSLKERLVQAQLEEYIQVAQKEVSRMGLTLDR